MKKFDHAHRIEVIYTHESPIMKQQFKILYYKPVYFSGYKIKHSESRWSFNTYDYTWK